jgi:hypothetical protein
VVINSTTEKPRLHTALRKPGWGESTGSYFGKAKKRGPSWGLGRTEDSEAELGFPGTRRRFLRFWRQCSVRRRIDRFTDLVSSRRSGHASHGSSRDCADGTTQSCPDNCAGSRTASGSQSSTDRLRTRLSCRIDRFTDLVSSRSSGHASHGSSRDCADGTTQSCPDNCAGSRTASSSRSGTDRMRTRLSRQFNFFVHHDEPPFVS